MSLSPVVERGERRTTEAKDKHRGTPQGGIISPLLSNLYFRRFLLAWQQFGFGQRLRAEVVNYADDLVLLCPSGREEEAMAARCHLMSRLGLTVNEKKTRLLKLPDEHFDFLGYTVGQYYGKGGQTLLGYTTVQKSEQAVNAGYLRRHVVAMECHQSGKPDYGTEPDDSGLGELLQPGTNSEDLPNYPALYGSATEDLVNASSRGTGYRRYLDEYLYETLGLYRLPLARNDLLNAKV